MIVLLMIVVMRQTPTANGIRSRAVPRPFGSRRRNNSMAMMPASPSAMALTAVCRSCRVNESDAIPGKLAMKLASTIQGTAR